MTRILIGRDWLGYSVVMHSRQRIASLQRQKDMQSVVQIHFAHCVSWFIHVNLYINRKHKWHTLHFSRHTKFCNQVVKCESLSVKCESLSVKCESLSVKCESLSVKCESLSANSICQALFVNF